MNYTQIILDRQGEVAWLTLHRPDKMNALTEVMLQEWKAILMDLEKDETCRCIVVTGSGRAWSAGVDLSIFQKIKVEPGYDMHQDGIDIMELLETMPQVTIAMLNGFCFTGAMEILMAFDFIIAAEEAKIGDTHAKWGIPPKWGMTQRLQHQVGLRKAKELSFTCQAISGKEAEKIGLVNRAVPLAELKKTVDEWIAKILPNSAQAIGAIKNLYHYSSMHTLEDGIQYELDYEMKVTDKKDDLKNFKDKI